MGTREQLRWEWIDLIKTHGDKAGFYSEMQGALMELCLVRETDTLLGETLTTEDFIFCHEYAKRIIESQEDPRVFTQMMRALKAGLHEATEYSTMDLWNKIQALDKTKSTQNSPWLSKAIGVGLKVLGAMLLVAAVSAVLVSLAPAASAAAVAAVGKALMTATFYITLGAKYIAGTSVVGQLAVVVAEAGAVAFIGNTLNKAGNYMFSGTAEKRKMMKVAKDTHEKVEKKISK